MDRGLIPFTKPSIPLLRHGSTCTRSCLDARRRDGEPEEMEDVLLGEIVRERNRRRGNAFLERGKPQGEVFRCQRRYLLKQSTIAALTPGL